VSEKNDIIETDSWRKRLMEEQEKEKEIKELDEWMKSILDGRELKRGIAVKLVKQGWRYRAIAEILNVSNSFISKWKSRFESAGVMGLKLSYKGAKII
jgi:putative transposase